MPAATTVSRWSYAWWAGESSPWAGGKAWYVLRCWIVLMQAVTLIKTAPAWWNRAAPPQLPLFDQTAWLQIDWYIPLLASLVVVPIVARTGIILHGVALLLSILADQTRLQPQLISPVLLLWGTLPCDNAKRLARVHLGTLWFYAGLHKLLAVRYLNQIGAQIFTDLMQLQVDESVARGLGISAALTELLLGILILFPRCRIFTGWTAAAMHGAIFLGATNIPYGLKLLSAGDAVGWTWLNPISWKQPVWPWNLSLMFAGWLFMRTATETPTALWSGSSFRLRAMMIVLLISPLTYYLGWLNPYLAHCLYSGNVVIGYVEDRPGILPRIERFAARAKLQPDGTRTILGAETSTELGLSLPPSERIFVRYFERTAQPGRIAILSFPSVLNWRDGRIERTIWFGRGELINGVKQGPWIEIDDDGLRSEGSYLDGEMHGSWRFENSDGGWTTGNFEQGVLRQN